MDPTPYRILVMAGKEFNNYFLVQYYLSGCVVPGHSHLITISGIDLDRMVDFYVREARVFHDSVNVMEPLDASRNRNPVWDLVRMADCLFVFRSESSTPEIDECIKAFKDKKKAVHIRDVFASDRVTDKPLSNPEGDPVPFNDLYGRFMPAKYIPPSEYAMMFVDRMLGASDLLKVVLENARRPLTPATKSEKSAICLLTWILENQKDTLLDLYEKFKWPGTKKRNIVENSRDYKEVDPPDWCETGERVPTYTATGLQLSRGYTATCVVRQETYLVIEDKDLIRQHVHRSLEDITVDDDDEVTEFFRTSEPEGYPVFHRVKELGNDPFPLGSWCINVKYTSRTGKNPTNKQEKENEEA